MAIALLSIFVNLVDCPTVVQFITSTIRVHCWSALHPFLYFQKINCVSLKYNIYFIGNPFGHSTVSIFEVVWTMVQFTCIRHLSLGFASFSIFLHRWISHLLQQSVRYLQVSSLPVISAQWPIAVCHYTYIVILYLLHSRLCVQWINWLFWFILEGRYFMKAYHGKLTKCKIMSISYGLIIVYVVL